LATCSIGIARVTVALRLVLAVGLCVASLQIAGCTSDSRPHQAVSNCANGPVIASPGKPLVTLTSCAGRLPGGTLPSITVGVGATLTLRGLGRSYAAPTSSAPLVLTVVSNSGVSAEFHALAAGTALVSLRSPFCATARGGYCAVATVHVKS
jgi:hypothetical protein